MTYSISISNSNNYHYGSAPLKDEQEFENFKKLCEEQTNTAGFWKASIIPIRTDLDNLAGDLIFPTLINGVIKTEKAAEVGFILLAIFWDVATLAVRLLTLVPRAVYNLQVKPVEHPLVNAAKEKGIYIVDSDKVVHVKLFENIPDAESGAEVGRYYKIADYARYKVLICNKETPFLDYCRTQGTSCRLKEAKV